MNQAHEVAGEGLACAITLGVTWVGTYQKVHHAEEEIATTKAAYQKLRKAPGREDEDNAILAEIEKRIQEMHPGTGPAQPAPVHHN